MRLFFLSSYCARIDTKNGLRGRLGRKRKYIMTEYPPQISLPLIALGNFYWSANLLNLLTNQAQNDLHIIKQLKAVAWSKVLQVCGHYVGSHKMPFIQV